MSRIVIDCRKANDAGIGRYIRELVPLVIQALPSSYFYLLVCDKSVISCLNLSPSFSNWECIIVPFAPFSLSSFLLLHRHLPRAYDSFWAVSLAFPLFAKQALFITIHDVYQLDMPASRLQWLIFFVLLTLASLKARRIYCISSFTSSRLLSNLPGIISRHVSKKILITPNGVSDFFRAPNRTRQTVNSRFFATVGSIRTHKSLQLAIKALSLYPLDSRPLLKIIYSHYDPVCLGRLRQYVIDVGVHENVEFCPAISDLMLRAVYETCLAVIIPSSYEGFGLPMLEALSAGCPVISSDAPALVEVGQEFASYFAVGDAVGCYRHMRRIDRYRPELHSSVTAHISQFDWRSSAFVIGQDLSSA